MVGQKAKAILGLKTCIDLELIKKVESIDSDNHFSLNLLLKKYDYLFKGVGCFDKEYHIELKENYKPVVVPPRKIPFVLEGKLKFTLDELDKNKIIIKKNEGSEWLNPIVIVRKKDESLRICLDPKDINDQLKKNFLAYTYCR